ncbi:MAG: ATP-binding protein [Chloroflexota bacterium]|nr:ATP-binding protein [Chloroflexota bacterium]
MAASSIYAAIVFVAVHAVYGFELGRAGVSQPPSQGLLGSVDTVTLAVWLGLSLIAGTALYRLSRTLDKARDASLQRQDEVGSIFAIGQALSGSLELGEIAKQFLRSAKSALHPSITSSLYVQDDLEDGFRLLAEEGPHAGQIWRPSYSASGVPGAMRTKVVDHRQTLLMPDTATHAAWRAIAAELTGADSVRSFAALPVVSHDRLVGIAAFTSDQPGTITGDSLQLVALISQFVASAIRTSLTFAEAERRASRESIVNRVAQRARGSLGPDEVLRATLEDLGRALDVSRVVAQLGKTPDTLRLTQEWNAPGIKPLGLGSPAQSASRVAAQTGRTSQTIDEMSRLATPISVAGELTGALVAHAETTREWSVHDVRLLEAAARELRGAMESARLFQAREKENERLLALQRASTIVAASSTTREVIDEVLRTASSLLGEASASLYLWDPAAEALRLAQNADPAGRPVSILLSREPGGSGEMLARLEPVIVNDYPAWLGATPTGTETGVRAALGVPLVRGGSLLGAIVLRAFDADTRFAIDDARLLSLFGDQAVAALTNAEAFERQRVAMEQLERLNRAKSEFVSIVSHEFRTPLTGIQGFSEMMRDEDLSMPEMKEYSADINKDAMRLTRMINEMLDLDRMESGRMTLHREPTDVNALVSDAAARVRPNAPGHPITLELEPGLPSLSADHDRLMQVVANLLSNAVKYSPTGGEIMVTTALDGQGIQLSVADHGIGIPPEKLEDVWERYSRIETDKTRGIQGTGLGLPIVRLIVTMHGGRTWAESAIGRGSTFHVSLPLAATSQAVEA